MAYDSADLRSYFEHHFTYIAGFERNVARYRNRTAMIDPGTGRTWSYGARHRSPAGRARGSRRTRLSIRHSRSRPRRPCRLPAVQHPGVRHRLSRHAADRRNRSPHQLPTLPGRDRLHPAGLRPTGLPLCAEGRFHRRGCPVLLGRPSSCRRRRSSPHRDDRRRRGLRCRVRRTCFRRRTRGVDDLR